MAPLSQNRNDPVELAIKKFKKQKSRVPFCNYQSLLFQGYQEVDYRQNLGLNH